MAGGTEVTTLELPKDKLIHLLMMPALSIYLTVLMRINSPKQPGCLQLYACRCVCTHLYKHTHTHTHTHVHAHAHAHAHTHTHTHTFHWRGKTKKVIPPRVLNLGMWEQIGTHVTFVFVQPNISHQAGELQALRTQFKQCYRLHFDLVSQYSKSLTKRLREGINSQV